MKHSLLALLLSGALAAQAQAPQAAAKDPLTTLREIKTANELHLKQQQETLKKLEELEATSRTIRILTKRG